MKIKKANIFLISIIVLAAAVMLFALFGNGGSVETASVILPTPITGGETQGSEGNGEGGLSLAEVTPRTVQSIIERLSRAESYSRTVTVEEFWDGGSSNTELSAWTSGGSTLIRLAAGDKIENILLRDGTLYIWYDNSEEVYSASSGDTGAARADGWLRCLTYEDLLEMPVSAITNAGYTDYAGEACIFAEYYSENFGYRNVVYVSVSTGLLIGAETYDGDILIYRMTSGTPDLSVPNESLLLPPGKDKQS
ncbi:MAG: hypothetical protein EOM54_05470 [Clostridia bacterium]|nr:hypothetical protein [Clostridia bacterium]